MGRARVAWRFARAKVHHAAHHAVHARPLRAADREVLSDIWRLRIALALVGIVLIYGTIGFRIVEGWPLFDALYMTVITISTVGFTEVHPMNDRGRAFAITLILAGVGSLFYTLGAAFELLLSEQFSHWRGRRRMQKAIDAMSGHYIICGFGRIGRQVASDLQEAGRPFVIIESKPERCALIQERGYPFVDGDATLDETLLDAGIERARAMVGALNDDASNVMVTVSARGLNPNLFIIARAALPESEKKLSRAGADEVISPYTVGGRRISLSMLRPAVSNFLNAVLYDRELQAEFTEYAIEEGSPFDGQTLTDAGMAHDRDVLPIAILRGGRLIFSPPAHTILHAGDTLIIVVPTESLRLARE
jgi:voltage-gated potassium channel